MTNTASTREIESLAAEIGENIYIDVAKWHLFLAEAHLHIPVAEAVYPLLSEDLREQDVTAVLQNISVSLGEGKRLLPLADLIPSPIQKRLFDLLEEYQRNL